MVPGLNLRQKNSFYRRPASKPDWFSNTWHRLKPLLRVDLSNNRVAGANRCVVYGNKCVREKIFAFRGKGLKILVSAVRSRHRS